MLIRELQEIKERVKYCVQEGHYSKTTCIWNPCFCNLYVIVVIVCYTRSEFLAWLRRWKKKGKRWGTINQGRQLFQKFLPKGSDYSRRAINQGMAIIQRNTVIQQNSNTHLQHILQSFFPLYNHLDQQKTYNFLGHSILHYLSLGNHLVVQ